MGGRPQSPRSPLPPQKEFSFDPLLITRVDFANEVSKVLEFPVSAPVSRETENELSFMIFSNLDSVNVCSDPLLPRLYAWRTSQMYANSPAEAPPQEQANRSAIAMWLVRIIGVASFVSRCGWLSPGLARSIRFSQVAAGAKGLKIFKNGETAFAPRSDVVDVELDAGDKRGSCAAGATREAIPL